MLTSRLIVRRLVSRVAKAGSRGGGRRPAAPGSAVVDEGFVFERPARPMSHAATLVESGGGLVAAWFAGTLESHPDVSIWVARNDGGGWSEPQEVANGVAEEGRRHACWNPVLFQPSAGPLLLFYKVGPNPRAWWGMVMASEDGGRSWDRPRRLPDGILGPIKNKPVELAGGGVLSPSSIEDDGWRVHIERSRDQGRSWTRGGPLNDGRRIAAIQPSILVHADGRLQLLCRTKQRRVSSCWSDDGGESWSEMRLTDLPNPNSGTDAVSLADGRHLLVYNPSPRWRAPLTVALSDDGETWRDALTLSGGPGEYSYPAVIQTADGRVRIAYTWNLSHIRQVTLDPGKI